MSTSEPQGTNASITVTREGVVINMMGTTGVIKGSFEKTLDKPFARQLENVFPAAASTIASKQASLCPGHPVETFRFASDVFPSSPAFLALRHALPACS